MTLTIDYTRRHTIMIVASPKFDAADLVAAVCSCGLYRSGPATRSHARKAGLAHVAAKTIAEARTTLTAGLTWLQHTEQPPGALTWRGVSRTVGDRTFRFVPSTVGVGRLLVVMGIRDPGADAETGTPAEVTLSKDDVRALRDELTRQGHPPISTWNGPGRTTVSVLLPGHPHPTLSAAFDPYAPLYPRQDEGAALLVHPDWPDHTTQESTRSYYAASTACRYWDTAPKSGTVGCDYHDFPHAEGCPGAPVCSLGRTDAAPYRPEVAGG